VLDVQDDGVAAPPGADEVEPAGGLDEDEDRALDVRDVRQVDRAGVDPDGAQGLAQLVGPHEGRPFVVILDEEDRPGEGGHGTARSVAQSQEWCWAWYPYRCPETSRGSPWPAKGYRSGPGTSLPPSSTALAGGSHGPIAENLLVPDPRGAPPRSAPR